MKLDAKEIDYIRDAVKKHRKGADCYEVAFSVICAYIGQKTLYKLSGYIDGLDYCKAAENGLKMDHKAYAEKVILHVSYNDPRVYARVTDNSGKELFTAWLDSENAAAASIVAGVAYEFMRLFNLYMFVNFGDE